MEFKKKLSNPFKLKSTKMLQNQIREATLEGGTEGSDESSPEATAASSADSEFTFGVILATSLDALLGMHHSALAGDRKELDASYEALITSVEGYRDATPKA